MSSHGLTNTNIHPTYFGLTNKQTAEAQIIKTLKFRYGGHMVTFESKKNP